MLDLIWKRKLGKHTARLQKSRLFQKFHNLNDPCLFGILARTCVLQAGSASLGVKAKVISGPPCQGVTWHICEMSLSAFYVSVSILHIIFLRLLFILAWLWKQGFDYVFNLLVYTTLNLNWYLEKNVSDLFCRLRNEILSQGVKRRELWKCQWNAMQWYFS